VNCSMISEKVGDKYRHTCRVCGVVRISDASRYVRNCPEPITEAEIARRQIICRLCEDWDATGTEGCQLIPARERTRLTEIKWRRGHCARGCGGGKRKW